MPKSKISISPPRATITPDQYREAYKGYHWFAHKVVERLNDEHKHLEFEVNSIIALNAAIATYDDIDRYKSYHLRNASPGGTIRSDSVKRAAYFAKWTARFRPITYRVLGAPKSDPDDMSLMANETLAAAYAIELIGSELNKHLKFSDKTFAEILYDLHYREMSDGALMAIFQVIWDLAKDGMKNPIIEIGVT